MNVVEKNSWTLMPAAPGLCPECATEHPPEVPHNFWSAYYHVRFTLMNGRAPTVDDSMSHCTPEMRDRWIKAMNAVERMNAVEEENKLSD